MRTHAIGNAFSHKFENINRLIFPGHRELYGRFYTVLTYSIAISMAAHICLNISVFENLHFAILLVIFLLHILYEYIVYGKFIPCGNSFYSKLRIVVKDVHSSVRYYIQTVNKVFILSVAPGIIILLVSLSPLRNYLPPLFVYNAMKGYVILSCISMSAAVYLTLYSYWSSYLISCLNFTHLLSYAAVNIRLMAVSVIYFELARVVLPNKFLEVLDELASYAVTIYGIALIYMLLSLLISGGKSDNFTPQKHYPARPSRMVTNIFLLHIFAGSIVFGLITSYLTPYNLGLIAYVFLAVTAWSLYQIIVGTMFPVPTTGELIRALKNNGFLTGIAFISLNVLLMFKMQFNYDHSNVLLYSISVSYVFAQSFLIYKVTLLLDNRSNGKLGTLTVAAIWFGGMSVIGVLIGNIIFRTELILIGICLGTFNSGIMIYIIHWFRIKGLKEKVKEEPNNANASKIYALLTILENIPIHMEVARFEEHFVETITHLESIGKISTEDAHEFKSSKQYWTQWLLDKENDYLVKIDNVRSLNGAPYIRVTRRTLSVLMVRDI